MEEVAPGELRLVLGGVERGHRVDDVQLGVGAELVEHPHGGLAAERADLDHPFGASRSQHRLDHHVEEGIHAGSIAPQKSARCGGRGR